MARSPREKAQGRREGGFFIPLPIAVLQSENFKTMSPKGKLIFWALMAQIEVGKGGARNNGNLCASPKMVKSPGLKSDATIHEGTKEVLARGFIEQTRQGGLHMGPNLYAFTFWPINECNGKLDCRATVVASGNWKRWPQKIDYPLQNL